MVIHINQDTVHIGLKGVTWAANVVGWSGGVEGGGFAAQAASPCILSLVLLLVFTVMFACLMI
jgi:hypothetical protein